MIFPESVFERLVEHSVSTPGPRPTPCWVWSKGCCNKGYGFVYYYCAATPTTGKGRAHRRGKSVGIRAHIASWVIANGPVPAGMTLDHLCRNTRCIRPSHLEPVTNVENVQRAHRARKRHTARTTTVTFGKVRDRSRSTHRQQSTTR